MSGKDEIRINGRLIDGKFIPNEEFDYRLHVLDPYKDKHGTLDGQPLVELVKRKFIEFVRDRMRNMAEKGGDGAGTDMEAS